MFSVFVTNIIIIDIIIIIVCLRVVPVKLKSFVSFKVIKSRKRGRKTKNKEGRNINMLLKVKRKVKELLLLFVGLRITRMK